MILPIWTHQINQMGKVDNRISLCHYLEKSFLATVTPLNMALPQKNLPCDSLSIWTLPSYEFSLYTPMFLHLYILTLFGVHEYNVAWLKPLCHAFYCSREKIYLMFPPSNHQTYSSIMPSVDLNQCSNYSSKNIILVPFLSTDVGHIIAYL